MLKSLLSYWWSIQGPWLNSRGFVGSGWVVGFAFLVWPAALSGSLQFWFSIKKYGKMKKVSPIAAGILFVICFAAWYLPPCVEWRPWCIKGASVAVFWLLGCILYEMPAAAWHINRKKK